MRTTEGVEVAGACGGGHGMTRMITEGGWGWRATGVLTETRRHGGFFRGGFGCGGIRLGGDLVGGRFGWGEMFDWWWVLVGWWWVLVGWWGGELGDADDAAAGVLVD